MAKYFTSKKDYLKLFMNAYCLSQEPDATTAAAGGSIKRRIARAFGLKAARYEANAVVQKRLIKKLYSVGVGEAAQTELWIDLGCGTGLFERECARRGGRPRRCLGLDLALEPLRYMKKRIRGMTPAVQGDIDALPFKRGVFDGAVLASTLQWLDDPFGAVARAAALLRGNGRLLFAVYVNGSFSELIRTRSRFALSTPAEFVSPLQLTEAFSRADLDLVHHELVCTALYFPDARTLLKSVSGIGAAVTRERPLPRGLLSDFCGEYERAFRTARGVPLTYRAMLGVCRKRI